MDEPAPQRTAKQRSPRIAIAAVLAVLVAGGALAIVLLGGGSGGDSTTAAGDCATVEAAQPKKVDLPRPKEKRPSASAVVFDTNCGSFTVTLDPDLAPRTAASFQYLAEHGVYDGTSFHRIVPGFVIQGGDPKGDGTGGPGYSITERPPSDLSYRRGLVAMAKTGAEPPGTSGSQFFVVTAPADAGLPPDYAPVGKVSDGFDTVLAIEKLADPSGASEQPVSPVVIEKATVEE